MIDARLEAMFPTMVPRDAEEPEPPPVAALPPGDDEPESMEERAERLFGQSPPAEYKFTAPKGFEHLVPDPVAHAEFSQIARGLGLSQAKAQSLVDLHIRRTFGGKG